MKALWKLCAVFSKCRSKVTVNLLYRQKGLVIRNTHAKYESPISWCNQSCQKTTSHAWWQPSLHSSQGKSFSKLDQASRSKSQGQKLQYHVKGLDTRNTCVQYESPISCDKGVRPRLKFFAKEGQTSRSRGQKSQYHVKGLETSNVHVQYESPITSGNKVKNYGMNTLSLLVKKLWPRSNFKVWVTRSKVTVLCEMS